MKVLLVDDEQEFVTTLVERLRMRDVEAHGVTSGKAAIEQVRAQPYDVVVLDLKMAGLGGVETMQRIQAIHPDTAFIILTGHTDQRDMARGLETGARFHLMKPLDIDVLLDKIRQCGCRENESHDAP